MKLCRACGEKKPFHGFHRRKDSDDGYRNDCKSCHKNRCESYRQAHLEEDKKQKRAYFKKNKERLLQLNKQWALDHPEKMRAYRSNWKRRNPEKVAAMKPDKATKRTYEVRSKYGLEPSEHKRIFDEHGGKCAICRKPESCFKKALHLDHCHKTGMMRGLLCVLCNTKLGRVKEDPKKFPESAHYLRKYKLQQET